MWLTVSPEGDVVDCDATTEQLLQRSHAEITGRPLADIFPALAGVPLLTPDGLNPRLRYRARIGARYEAVVADDRHLPCMLTLNLLQGRAGQRLTVIAEPLGGAA